MAPQFDIVSVLVTLNNLLVTFGELTTFLLAVTSLIEDKVLWSQGGYWLRTVCSSAFIEPIWCVKSCVHITWRKEVKLFFEICRIKNDIVTAIVWAFSVLYSFDCWEHHFSRTSGRRDERISTWVHYRNSLTADMKINGKFIKKSAAWVLMNLLPGTQMKRT